MHHLGCNITGLFMDDWIVPTSSAFMWIAIAPLHIARPIKGFSFDA